MWVGMGNWGEREKIAIGPEGVFMCVCLCVCVYMRKGAGGEEGHKQL